VIPTHPRLFLAQVEDTSAKHPTASVLRLQGAKGAVGRIGAVRVLTLAGREAVLTWFFGYAGGEPA